MPHFLTAALYKFVALPDFARCRRRCWPAARSEGHAVAGRGRINGTIAGSVDGIEAVPWTTCAATRDWLTWAQALVFEAPPFQRMKVRLKRERS